MLPARRSPPGPVPSPNARQPGPETGYHQCKAAELTRVAGPAPRPGPSLRRRGAARALAAVSVALAVEAGRALAAPHLAAAERPARPVSSVTAASATRDQAAVWVPGQVSGGAVLACDPAMCAALAQRGIPAGNLLVLGPGSGDPLGSAALAAGQVDERLLITVAALAANEPVWVDAFGGRGPGESPGLALRTAEIAAPAASARRMLAFVRAQRSPYLATRADLSPDAPATPGPDGYVLTIEFGAPAPRGMLG